MNCTYCGTTLHPLFSAATVRCDRCGAVHHADGSVISPRMLPITTGLKMSPWMFAHTRPIEPGIYECKFRDVEPVLTLYWNGQQFMQVVIDKPVRCATLISWRGQWAT